MAKRLIGLDIGTNAVTVAEVSPGDPPVLRTFGQVGLRPEAMSQGEVFDPAPVSEAVKRLWREVGLPKRAEVRVGIATPRAVVRQVDLPEMADADIAGALRYQAAELIPIPLEDAAYDYLVLDHFEPEPPETAEEAAETGTTEKDAGGVRILLAAAQRSIVESLVGAVRGAGLKVGAVDLVPLALIRSLGRRVAANGPGAEAIVSLGAGVSMVVVHEGGVPRFVRMVGTGGRDLTSSLAEALDVPFGTAEAVKRGVEDLPLDVARGADEALARPVGDLLEEVRGSLDYYRAQPDALPVLRVVVTGGGRRSPVSTTSSRVSSTSRSRWLSRDSG
ncbi:MAG: pilus assembly protein PilM [Acidimicrobiia bacterium]|nr:pilus assembly protein PilM [Acidimicrobiia bacterium]